MGLQQRQEPERPRGRIGHAWKSTRRRGQDLTATVRSVPVMGTPPIIAARGLRKEFRAPGGRTVVAVSDLTMDIEPGSLTAFLGPNGAGKSTSLRMLTTLLEPTGGTATVCGYDVTRSPAEVRARIGYIGQKNGAGQYQRVRDELLSQGAFYGLGRAETRRRADELIEALGLGEVADRQTLKLSGGQRRRVDIALGLIPGPGLLFLDEPSTGLDPQSRANLWEHILRLRERYGMTLLLTTHYLDEADQFADASWSSTAASSSPTTPRPASRRPSPATASPSSSTATTTAPSTSPAGPPRTRGRRTRSRRRSAPARGPASPSPSTTATACSRCCCARWTPTGTRCSRPS
ncbi:ABC transporter ATP-binding protein [Georgenia sp. SUBG003]|uniref:ABC transporter ATP-binding protein n=1 Tax=Georgenia sp. SUBG003 TaxID=1497974 RepID=UPI003AB242D9